MWIKKKLSRSIHIYVYQNRFTMGKNAYMPTLYVVHKEQLVI